MDSNEAAERFVDLFHNVFLRFHTRQGAMDRALSMEAFGVLEHLAGTGPLTVTEAARHFGRSQAATSEIVARLEARGLLVRYPDERDRRRHLVWMSQEGVDAWRHATRVLSTTMLSEAFAQLTSEDRADLLLSLNKLLDSKPNEGEQP
ncbi:MAG TPA: MarR family transcriptional regulator [Phycisphaerae bacterium]|nr:MarR family transcriptional regulator [Phycisphaerae bacterium]